MVFTADKSWLWLLGLGLDATEMSSSILMWIVLLEFLSCWDSSCFFGGVVFVDSPRKPELLVVDKGLAVWRGFSTEPGPSLSGLVNFAGDTAVSSFEQYFS